MLTGELSGLTRMLGGFIVLFFPKSSPRKALWLPSEGVQPTPGLIPELYIKIMAFREIRF